MYRYRLLTAKYCRNAIICICLFVSILKVSGQEPDDNIDIIFKNTVKHILTVKEMDTPPIPEIEKLIEMIKNKSITKNQFIAHVENALAHEMKTVRIHRHNIKKYYKLYDRYFYETTGKSLSNICWDYVNKNLDSPLKIKIATLAPDGTAWIKVPREKLVPHIAKISGGKIEVVLYTGGIMGEDADVVRKIDIGQLDGCGCTALGVFKASPEVSIFSLPGLFKSYEEVDYIFNKFRKEIDKSFLDNGLILAALIDTGFFNLYSTVKIDSFDQLRKERLMTWFGDIEAQTYEELGIKPIPISVPEVTTSISTGMVNACVAPAPWILGTQVYPKLKYIVTNNLFYSPAAIFVSKDILEPFKDKFTENELHNVTELLIFEILTFEKTWIYDECRPFEKKCIQAFYKYGLKPVTLNDDEMRKFEKAAKRTWFKMAGKIYPRELLDNVLAALDNYRKE